MPEISNKLRRRVAAVNKANDLANRLQAEYIEAAWPLVGKKIKNKDGSITKNAQKIINGLSIMYGDDITVQRESSIYWLSFTISVRYYADNEDRTGYRPCSFEKAGFTVGKIENHILTALATEQQCAPRKTDYNPETIASLREQLDAAQKVVRDLESALSPFGEYDR